jgi:hypothetical protein
MKFELETFQIVLSMLKKMILKCSLNLWQGSLSQASKIHQVKKKHKVREGTGEESGGGCGGQTRKNIQAIGSPDIKKLWAAWSSFGQFTGMKRTWQFDNVELATSDCGLGSMYLTIGQCGICNLAMQTWKNNQIAMRLSDLTKWIWETH